LHLCETRGRGVRCQVNLSTLSTLARVKDMVWYSVTLQDGAKLYRYYNLYRPQHACGKPPKSRSTVSLPRHTIANITICTIATSQDASNLRYQAGVLEESVAKGALTHNSVYWNFLYLPVRRLLSLTLMIADPGAQDH
jgi:hypothetical protein